ncbi:hypothetical protein A7985_14685 [Pseudoalteromonas luteoviolacea]|uniref:Carrier domain-containing protein n=1 Tax=Pseudoalteromonas luteoviolacea TaxID=43657 RepID=A0A1C0TQ21_9GAMM|nr:non-ribosomal peptide synthetase [Pseudoalteromonas luteoviolacea]OCQ21027.1 hypothetical protein A7985_14685 [Pseudoalteromonas luteoviolacea]
MNNSTNSMLGRLAMEASQMESEKAYWSNTLSGVSNPANFPLLTSQPSSGVESYEFILSDDVSSKLNAISSGLDQRLFVILMSSLSILLFKYSDNPEVLLAMPAIDKNSQEKVANQLLPVSVPLHDEMTVKAVLSLTKDAFRDVLVNQQYPLLLLREELKREGFDLFNTLKRVQISLQGFNTGGDGSADTEQQIHWQFAKQNDVISCKIDYSQAYFMQTAVMQLAHHFEFVLQQMLDSQATSLSALSLAPEEELLSLYQKLNDTQPATCDMSISELFDKQCMLTPNKVALISHGVESTYLSLNEQANTLCAFFKATYAIECGSKVALLLDKSTDAIITILAILKAGATYVPLDSSWPTRKTAKILAETQPELFVTDSEFLYEFDEFEGQIFIYDLQFDTLPEAGEAFSSPVSDSSPAYIMFTSGTTGKPKGVKIRHSGVTRLVYKTNFVALDTDTTILSTSSLAFDASTFEVWAALLNGGKLVFEDQNTLLNLDNFEQTLNKHQVTTLWLTSAWFNQLVDHNPSAFTPLKQLLVGGDKLSPNHVQRVLKELPDLAIINGYGPTENTTFSLHHIISTQDKSSVPLGTPISNSTAYIVDRDSNLLPKGVWGELLLGGAGLASGYLNDEEETTKRFVNISIQGLQQKVYHSGDLCRLGFDGNVEFLGRTDNQVKIRGFRIELEEIERILMSQNGVLEAKITVHGDVSQNKYLNAYLVVERDLNEDELLSNVASELPEYMLPKHIIQMDKFPLTSNGKIDVRQLPVPEVSTNEKELPETETEKQLAQYWADVLECDIAEIGRSDNFFDIGGHSLKATLLIARVLKEMKVNITLNDIFDSSQLNELAQVIEQTATSNYQSLSKAQHKEAYICTPQQRQLYLLHRLQPDALTYNIPIIFECEGEIDVAKLENAFATLIKRHESLRTRFSYDDGDISQIIEDHVECRINQRQANSDDYEALITECIKPFSLDIAPLLAVDLIGLEAQKHLLVINVHHIIFDAVSLSILISELNLLYTGEALPDLEFRYSDYAEWLNTHSSQDSQGYWLNEFSTPSAKLYLPLANRRPKVQKFIGKTVDFRIGSQTLSTIKKVANENGATTYMLLMACINIWLQKLSGQNEVVIGTPVAGRTNPDVTNIIGMFVNTLAIRNTVNADTTCIEFLQQVKRKTTDAFDNQLYPFEMLVENVVKERDTSRNPLFDIMFAWQNVGMTSPKLGELSLKPIEYHTGTSKFDINISASEHNDELYFSFEYNSVLFSEQAANDLTIYLQEVISSFATSPAQPLSEVRLISVASEETLLHKHAKNEQAFGTPRKVHEQVETYAFQKPDACAAHFNGQKLTYAQLNKRANALANTIWQATNGNNDIVVLNLSRSIELLVSIIAAHKAGCAFLIVDPELPSIRQQFMICDSGATLLIDQHQGALTVQKTDTTGEVDVLSVSSDTHNLAHEVANEDLAYIIYTSGSTGKPKGVKVPHRALLNFLNGLNGIYKTGLESTSGYLSLTNSSFDVAIAETMLSLFNGGQLTIVPIEQVIDVEAISDLISTQNVEFCYLPLVLIRPVITALNNKPNQLSKMLIGAEPIKDNVLDGIRQLSPSIEVVNGYGPSETTICASLYNCTNHIITGDYLPIGKPLANSELYVVNPSYQLQPFGVPGELLIAGQGLSHGYTNSELNASRFIEVELSDTTPVYATGDVVKWDKHGNLIFLGRKDDQIKVSGVRIEPGEIESVLSGHTEINEVVVQLRHIPGINADSLIAYYTSNQALHKDNLESWCSEQLPSYMMPKHFVHIQNPTLTLSGKIDRKALPLPAITSEFEITPPKGETERALASMWSAALNIPKEELSTTANFFDLGGNSKAVIELVAALTKTFNTKVTPIDLFSMTTIKELAAHIAEPQANFALDIEDLSF